MIPRYIALRFDHGVYRIFKIRKSLKYIRSKYPNLLEVQDSLKAVKKDVLAVLKHRRENLDDLERYVKTLKEKDL